jgi:YVTN family beta-propeller protein
LAAPDGTVYVTNRLGRSVSVIREGDTTESARIEVGVEPVGLAVSSDGRTLYVVNATSRTEAEFGTLQAIDTRTLTTKWEVAVGHEPRAITLMGDGKAAITLYKDGDLVLVDLAAGKVLKAGTRVFEQMNRAALGITTGATEPINRPEPVPFPGQGLSTSRPRGLEAITVSPDGSRLYVASLVMTDAVLNTGPATPEPDFPRGGGGSGYGGGTCGSTAVASAALLTFDAEARPEVDDVGTCTGDASRLERPPMLLTSALPEMPVQGPRALALDPTGAFLFIANFESNNVAIVPTSQRRENETFAGAPRDVGGLIGTGTVQHVVSVGAGPTGIAVAKSGKTAWVYNAFDHSVSRLESLGGRVANIETRKLTTREALSADAAAGRRLFFSAVDKRMNNPATGISCGTCHLEGREDGHVWNFPDGPRQTPSLQGRLLTKTAPFHWNGEFPDLMDFMSHTVTKRMGGDGVSAAMERQVAAFIDAMPAADNPHANLPADVKARGQAAYEKAECGSCHSGEAFTDNKFSDVGTFVTTGPVVDRLDLLPFGGLNTPSLLGLARTAPYLHDGSVQTLKARILVGKEKDLHGKTSRLSAQEVDDLVAYLKSL